MRQTKEAVLMTDISNWGSTIHTKYEELSDEEIAKYNKYFPDHKGPHGSEYAMNREENMK